MYVWWPNIFGTLGDLAANSSNAFSNGALYWSGQDSTFCSARDGSVKASFDPRIDASKSSSIYSGAAMQPKALNCLPCIRC